MKYKAGHLVDIINTANDFIDVFKNIIKAYLTDETQDKLYDPLEIKAWAEDLIKNPRRTLTFDLINKYAMPLPVRPHATEFFSKFLRYKIATNKYLEAPENMDFSKVVEDLLFTALSDTIENNIVLLGKIYVAIKDNSPDEVEDTFVFVRLAFSGTLTRAIQENKVLGNGILRPPKTKDAPLTNKTSSFEPELSAFNSVKKHTNPNSPPSDEVDLLSKNLEQLFTDKKPTLHKNKYIIERRDTFDSETGEPIENITVTPVQEYLPIQNDEGTSCPTTPKII